MNCPKCGAITRVWKTEKFDKLVERTRICVNSECLTGFITSEEISDIPSEKESKNVPGKS